MDTHDPQPPGGPKRGMTAAMAGAVVVTVAACQTYEPLPLDLEAHRIDLLARTPDGPEVRAFASGLAPRPIDCDSAFDLSDGLSASEAEVVALVFNSDLRLARLRAGVTRATAENAGLWDDPTIDVDLTRIVESVANPWKLAASVGLTLPISGRLAIESELAGADHAVELARIAESEWSVRLQVRRAWTEWSALDAQLATTREFVSRVDQALRVVDVMEAAGEMARTEARLFRIEKATRMAELATLESHVRESVLGLHRLMGLSSEAPVHLRAAGIGPPEGGSDADRERSAEAIEGRNPSLLIAQAEYAAAEKALELQIQKQYPDLSIGPGYGRDEGQDEVLLGLSLPIPILNANRQSIAEARARRDLAKAQAETTLESLLADFAAARLRMEAARRRREDIESELVPLVDSQYDEVRQVAQLGEVNTLVLLESLTRQQDAKVQLIRARRDESAAAIELDRLLGPPSTARRLPPDSPDQLNDRSTT